MSVTVKLSVNGKAVSETCPANTTLVQLLRERLQLTGTHVGCDTSQCGSCTVHVDGIAVRACVIPVSAVAGKSVTTNEGLSDDGSHPLQRAWIEEQVPQCGYCQSGQIMQAAALLAENQSPSRKEIVAHMDGNLCRCGTYPRIIRAIERASGEHEQ